MTAALRVLLHLPVVLLSAACGTAVEHEPSRAPEAGFTSDYISVVTRGSGPDVILVHGLGGHRDAWTGTADALSGRYRLHLVQILGFAGFARGSSDSLVAAPAARDIARYIREAELMRPALIGHSMGGMITMMVAAREPELVGRLMVVDMLPFMGPVVGPAGATHEGLRTLADQVRGHILATRAGAPDDMMTRTLPSQTRNERMVPLLLEHARASDRRTVADAMHELLVTDLRPELARITAPFTVLWVVPPTSPIPADQYAEAVPRLYADAPGVRLVRIADSNHFIQFDQPERFIAEVEAFLASAPGTAR